MSTEHFFLVKKSPIFQPSEKCLAPLVLSRNSFSRMVLIVTVVTTLSSFVKPTANAYVLNCFALHILFSLCVEMRR